MKFKKTVILFPVMGFLFLRAAPAQDLPPRGVVLDMADWIPCEVPAGIIETGSALDMSFLLDGPAGKHGFLKVKGERFVFEDGTHARFWGGNTFGEAISRTGRRRSVSP